jgi:hypothetical protein
MWLLDANLDVHLVGLLRGYEIDCDTAENRGWKALRNGDLVAAAVQNVARDRDWPRSSVSPGSQRELACNKSPVVLAAGRPGKQRLQL